MDIVFILEAILLIAIAVCFFLFVYAKLQKPSEMQKYVTVAIIGIILMLFGYVLEMNSTTLQSAYYATIMCYMGQPFLIVSSFLMICSFYGKKMPNWVVALMFLVAFGFTTMVYTNQYHNLYYTSIGFDDTQLFTPLKHAHGPLYALNVILMALYVIGFTIVAVMGYRKTKSKLKRRLSIYTALMVLSSITGFVLYSLDLGNGFDTTMLGLTGATIFLALLFFRCRVFDVVAMSKDYALDNSSEGLLIFDDVDNLVYQNKFAVEVIPTLPPKDNIAALPEGKKIVKSDSSVYTIIVINITHKDDYLGKCIEIRDITESYNYSERLEKAVADATDKLEYIQRTIVASFASLVEARSVETGDHIQRVSGYTEMIAKALQAEGKHADILTDDYISMLVHSAPLHDVGKISIPDAILLKPGKLTSEEFEIMKTHAPIGADVIKNTMGGLESEDYVKMAMEIAKHHHERWDGNGYPSGLKGEEIPLSARIVAVADCYDAMTSERCYKEAFPVDSALQIIKDESGTHFDPEVVDAFLSLKGHK